MFMRVGIPPSGGSQWLNIHEQLPAASAPPAAQPNLYTLTNILASDICQNIQLAKFAILATAAHRRQKNKP